MRHHSTSIVGPDIDGNEQAVWAKMFPYHTTPVKDAADPAPYPSDLLAACPWAKEAGLELVECGHDKGSGKWLWFRDGRKSFYHTGDKVWRPENTTRVQIPHEPSVMFGNYPTRADALKSPPPKPPGVVEAPAQPSVGDELGRVLTANMHGSSPWNHLSEPQKESRRVAALAVRREVLAEGFTKDDAAAAFSRFNSSTKGDVGAMLEALSAAIASRVKRAEKEDKR